MTSLSAPDNYEYQKNPRTNKDSNKSESTTNNSCNLGVLLEKESLEVLVLEVKAEDSI